MPAMCGDEKDKPEGVRVGWGLIASAILLFLAPVAGGVLYQAGYEQYAADRTREYADHADDQIGYACRGVSPSKMVICFANARIEGDLKKRDNERSEADLVAQRKTALWTMLMGAAAFVGMALSLIGVILVFRTFGATREANEIARDTAKRQLRAYVLGKDHAIKQFFAGGRMTFVTQLHNSGQTPASEVRCRTLVRATTGDVDEFKFMFRQAEVDPGLSNTIIGPDDFVVQPNEMNGPLAHEVWAQILRGEIKLMYAGVISYRDVFGKRHLTTFKYFFIPNPRNFKETTFDLTACGTGNKAN